MTRRSGVAEVVIPPRSALAGDRVFPGMVTDERRPRDPRRPARGRRHRPGRDRARRGRHAAAAGHVGGAGLATSTTPGARRRRAGAGAPAGRAAGRGARSGRWSCWRAMVLALATGVVPPAVAGLLAASAMILLGVLTVEQAQRGISWTTVVLVGGMISLSTAMVASGAAAQLADRLVDVVGDAGPARAAARPVRAHRGARPADLQHGDGADRDPDRLLGGGGHGRLRQARADGGDGVGGRLVPHARSRRPRT